MKRKVLGTLTLLLVCALAVFGFAACGNSGDVDHLHSYDQIVSEKYLKSEATCESAAVYYKSCSECGIKGKGTLEYGTALGHKYATEWTVDVEATCTAKGEKSHHCTVDGCDSRSNVTEIFFAAHNYKDGTCTECGAKKGLEEATGLEYTLSEDGTYYIVFDIGTETRTAFAVPYTYDDLPVKAIGASAFRNCSRLTSIELPVGVTSIGEYAFSGCSCLESIKFPAGLTSIGNNAFGDCTGLTSIELPAGLTSIENDTFRQCSGLTSIEIPDSVTSIGDSAFYYCTSLTSVTIGNGVASIGYSAFYNCYRLVEIYNRSSLTIEAGSEECGYVGYYALNVYTDNEGSSKLTEDENGYVIYTDGEEKILVGYHGTETDLVLPSEITKINDNAFYKCSSLTSVEIPDGVTSIGDWAFGWCSSLTSVTIGNSVTSIGDDAFWCCSSLTSVTIGNSVTSIRDDAFYNCYRLVEVYNRSSLTIEAGSSSNGYVGCYALNVYTDSEGSSKLTEDENGYVIYTDGEKKILVGYRGTDKDLVLPSGITEINKYTFYDCDNLTSVGIPDGVTSIGDWAFYKCSSLTSIEIPDGVTSIGIQAFSSCNSLESIEIPNGVTSIGSDAFFWCSSLTSIEIPDGVTSIGSSAFSSCSSLTSVTIGNGVTSIGSNAFSFCIRLTSVTIGNSVTSIAEDAFDYCTSLTSVYYTGTAEDWNKISINSSYNNNLTSATRYYYSETQPTDSGNYWHYDENGEIVVW